MYLYLKFRHEMMHTNYQKAFYVVYSTGLVLQMS